MGWIRRGYFLVLCLCSSHARFATLRVGMSAFARGRSYTLGFALAVVFVCVALLAVGVLKSRKVKNWGLLAGNRHVWINFSSVLRPPAERCTPSFCKQSCPYVSSNIWICCVCLFFLTCLRNRSQRSFNLSLNRFSAFGGGFNTLVMIPSWFNILRHIK